MDKFLEDYLSKFKIKYKSYTHKAVFTVSQSKEIDKKIPSMHTKNLFLKDETGSFYLVCIQADKRLDIHSLSNHLKVKKLVFSSPSELKDILHISPGSVSIFCLVQSNSVHLILDKDIWDSDFVGFHPNENTSTLVLSNSEFKKFFNSLKNKKEIIPL